VSGRAYRHRSLSEVSKFFKGQWYEHQHDPEATGKADSSRVGAPRKYKADPRIFKCYQSTATGDFTPSQAGTTLFSDSSIRNKIIILLAVVLAVSLFIYKFNRKSVLEVSGISASSVDTTKTPVLSDSKNNVSDSSKTSNAFVNPLSTVKVNNPFSALSEHWRISGVYRNHEKHKSFVLLSDFNGHTRRVTNCVFDQLGQPSCELDGQTITFYSGFTPLSNQPKLSKKDD
jgi:zona occludens toxin (predicted ATPase)